ncbi:oligopeptide/dipeptide ABC transporter ATP-binding protein [Pseudofrankia sp. DC12]|uniref:ABC transporter ATP-binding protein n=1 Tax=Pseudofrankia sp. DC12 TaxID=683315 RepID=UPI0005F7944D|nr:oligopeptide/dipeptide ABC transporter ATP-binding protein [Pseudofrankia sp. DC12]
MAGGGSAHLRESQDVLLRVEDLRVEFPAGRGRVVHAVSEVSLDVAPGETLGLVGESGCGKSTTGRAIVQLPRPTAGRVVFEGRDLTAVSRAGLRPLRPRMQLVHQDPVSSLNPRRTVRQIVEEPLRIWRRGDAPARAGAVDEILEAVGLNPAAVGGQRPRELSGGQCQRVSIARALVLGPRLVICDEAVSALDVSVQAQILNLLEDMKARYGLTMVFISHNLSVVRGVSDRVAVMYLGKLCEVGSPDAIYGRPAHPYTAALLSAVPEPDPEARPSDARVIGDELPSPLSPPSGCRFRTRCPLVHDRCAVEEPQLRPVADGHHVACHAAEGEKTAAVGASPRPGGRT